LREFIATLSGHRPNNRWNDLRHTFATRFAGAGVDPFTIRDLLGHATVMMNSDYTHSTPETRHAAILGLGEGKRSAETERGKIVAVR
jgi:site-specific recombinase XerD